MTGSGPDVPSATPEPAPERSRDVVQSLERGLAIIRAFTADAPSLSVTEIAERTGLTRAAARRFLLTLVDLGYVVTDGRSYELTPRVLELGYSYLSALSFPELALPHLERLVAEVQEASEGSILDGHEVVYVVRAPGPSIMTTSVSVGERMPAFATAMGRVLLAGLEPAELDEVLDGMALPRLRPGTITDPSVLRAELDRVRSTGFALVDQELEEGLVAVAVPVRDGAGTTVAAVNLSTHVGRRSASEIVDLLPALHGAAALIQRDLALPTPPGPAA